MKKLGLVLSCILVFAMLAALPVSAADPVTECNVTEKSAAVDGVVSEYEWDDATKLTLNISDTSTWSEVGAGIVGTTGWSDLGHTDADFSNSLSFMAEGDYLYILLERTDTTLTFATDDFRRPYASDCSLMWFYNTSGDELFGLQLLASDKSGAPHIGYFYTDANQGSSEDLVATGDAAAVTTVTANGYVMEA